MFPRFVIKFAVVLSVIPFVLYRLQPLNLSLFVCVISLLLSFVLSCVLYIVLNWYVTLLLSDMFSRLFSDFVVFCADAVDVCSTASVLSLMSVVASAAVGARGVLQYPPPCPADE